MKPVFEKHYLINGQSLFTRRYGSTGAHVLFIHGGPDWDHNYLLPYVLPLAEQFQLTFFDLRGCGRSSRLGRMDDYSLSLAAADVSGLIEALELTKPVVLGFSYGGRVALEAVRQTPEKVGALILASTTAYTDFQNDLDQWPEYRTRKTNEMNKTIQDALTHPQLTGAEISRQLAHASLPLDIWDIDKIDLAREAIQRVDFSGEWMAAWRAGKLKPSAEKYDEILSLSKIPTLILHGEKDMRFPVSTAHKLKAAVPDAELSVIPDTGHMAHIENPTLWNDSVRRFVMALPI